MNAVDVMLMLGGHQRIDNFLAPQVTGANNKDNKFGWGGEEMMEEDI